MSFPSFPNQQILVIGYWTARGQTVTATQNLDHGYKWCKVASSKGRMDSLERVKSLFIQKGIKVKLPLF